MNSNWFQVGITTLGLTVMLAGCGGTGDTAGNNNGGTKKYSKIGSVVYVSAPVQNATAGFYALPSSITELNAGSFPDACTVSKGNVTGPPTPVPGEGQTSTPLDAGDAVIFKNATTTLFTLKRQALGSGQTTTTYAFIPTGQPFTFPELGGATLEIPGATNGFPAMTATMPAALAAFTFAPSVDITKDTAFAWTGATTGAYMSFQLQSGTSPNQVFVSCFVKDTGSFSFSSATKVEMDSKGFTSGTIGLAGKTKYATKAQGDALLQMVIARTIFLNQ
jgi:hypothetical protein